MLCSHVSCVCFLVFYLLFGYLFCFVLHLHALMNSIPPVYYKDENKRRFVDKSVEK